MTTAAAPSARPLWGALRRMLQIAAVTWRSAYRLSRRVVPGGRREPQAPEVIRAALAELGATFVKLGQVLSTRPDLVPPRYESALATLQDAATPIALEEVLDAIGRELGGSPAEHFAEFNETPIAAASIGQVHAARLGDGREVVVKVRRPHVVAQVEIDLRLLAGAARLFSLLPGPTRRIDVVGFVEEFALTLRGELDYLQEGANAERIGAQLAGLRVHVPSVVWPLTTEGVLTLERIFGAKIDDLGALRRDGIDQPAVARSFATAYLSMVFRDGYFHADPHPGNLFVEHDGTLALVDFGMVGTVAPVIRHALAEILLALATGDERRTSAALRELGVLAGGADEERLVQELRELRLATVEVPLKELRFAPLLTRFMAVSRRHRFRFPRELVLLIKTVVMCEGVAAQLDPDFSLAGTLVAFVANGGDFGAPR
jgi:ubiquinone biosynthesis protein